MQHHASRRSRGATLRRVRARKRWLARHKQLCRQWGINWHHPLSYGLVSIWVPLKRERRWIDLVRLRQALWFDGANDMVSTAAWRPVSWSQP